MEIRYLNDDKIKISLTRQDMVELDLNCSAMDYSSERTRRALLFLLEKAKKQVGFSPRGAKLFIEVYPDDEGGCALYFTGIRKPTKLSETSAVISPTVFEFESAEDMIGGACKAFKRYSHRIYKSSLYLIGGRYRILVYNLDYSDKLSVYALSEFGTKLGDDEIFASYTIEHGKELICDTALDTLAKYFG